jgi:hypothetical protein
MAAPVKYTCPKTDLLIRNVRALMEAANSENEEGLSDTVLYHLKDFEYELEELRYSNDKLRSWGERLENILEDNNIDY